MTRYIITVTVAAFTLVAVPAFLLAGWPVVAWLACVALLTAGVFVARERTLA